MVITSTWYRIEHGRMYATVWIEQHEDGEGKKYWSIYGVVYPMGGTVQRTFSENVDEKPNMKLIKKLAWETAQKLEKEK